MLNLPPFFTHRLLILLLSLLLVFFPSCFLAQQPYAKYHCGRRNSASALGYNCNGVQKRCRTYLIYRSQPSYSNATAIANLFSTNVSEITQINNISKTSTLITGKELIVPITCSCAGPYYQSNTTYVVKINDSPDVIAGTVYEGLSTCAAIQNQRSLADQRMVAMFPNQQLTIPIRCACPTKAQASQGVKYLMTYIVKEGDTISTIAQRFGKDNVGLTLEANNKSVVDSIIEPITTLLVALQKPPNRSQTDTPEPSSSSPTPAPSPAYSSTLADHNKSSSKEKWYFLAGGLVGGVGIAVVIGALGICLHQQRVRKKTEVAAAAAAAAAVSSKKVQGETKGNQLLESKKINHIESLLDLESIPSIAKSLKIYSYGELRSATDDFSSSSLIRGSVYRGTIKGTKVAIKRRDADVAREIEILNKINHFNLISLIGICYNDGQWYLIYEYASNGALSGWIFQKDDHQGQKTFPLSWVQRVQIALDVATGLNYLHSYTSPPQVHKDIKCGHVLLNEEFRAKISHFGLAKSIVGGHGGGQFALTEHIIGTKGYMAPEYLESGLVTTKLDVYAFGVLLAELLSGKEVAELLNEKNVSLSSVLVPIVEDLDGKDKLGLFMDLSLKESYPVEVASVMIQLVERCVRREPSERPEMEEIVRFMAKTLTTTMIMDSSTGFSISSETTEYLG